MVRRRSKKASCKMRKIGGILAGLVLTGIGIFVIIIALSGRVEVADSLKQEKITGTPDMTPAAAAAEVAQAGLPNVAVPTCSVADQPIETGSDAKCFAEYIRIHTLQATQGKTYSEMPRYVGANGVPTNDETQALKNPASGRPQDNPARQIWITSTALQTALNTSYFAERVALFSLVVGICLLLVGIGLIILALAVFGRPARPHRR